MLSDTCLAAISKLVDSRDENDPCFYYNNLIAYATTPIERERYWEKYLLPNVIVWDPMTQIINLKLQCPLCIQDGRSGIFLKKTVTWEKGHQTAQIPRKVWDYGWICLLVGRTYRCVMQHSVRSYHAGVLRQLNYDKIPFVLSHESGMTRTYLDTAFRLMEEKSSFYQVRAVMSKLFCDTYMHRRILCPDRVFPNISDVFKTTSPSEYLFRLAIQSYFRVNFWKYSQHFVDLPVKMLVCDFIFHGENIIGCANNRKWVTSHDSLFIAANENGAVKSFKFTYGAQFEQVLKMLASIAKTSAELKFICIDNCCGLREILKEIFPKTEIKLHPSHVIKRLLDCIPANHPAYSDFVKDLRKVFRAKNDYFLVRHQPTPPSTIMLENLSKFYQKWKLAESEGWSLVTPTFTVELENVKVHIENDCLSDIPPDNYEEKYSMVSEHISKVILKNKFTFADAQALMTHLIYSLNLKSKEFQNSKTKDYFYQVPIWSVKYPYIDKSATLIENGMEPSVAGKEDELLEACASLQQLQHSVVVNGNEIVVEDSSVKKVLALADLFLFFQNILEESENPLPDTFKGMNSLELPSTSLKNFVANCKEKEAFPVKELSKLFVKDGFGIAETKKQGLIVCLELILRNLNTTKELPEQYALKIKDMLNSHNVSETLKDLLDIEVSSERNEYYVGLLDNSKDNIENESRENSQENEENNENNENSPEDENDLFNKCLKTPHIFPILAANTCKLNLAIIPLCHEMKLYPVFPHAVLTSEICVVIYDPADDSFLPLMKIPNFSLLPKAKKKMPAAKCTCGSNDRDVKARCNHGRCPCMKIGVNCRLACRCKGCQNSKEVKKTLMEELEEYAAAEKGSSTQQTVESSQESENTEETNDEPPQKKRKFTRRKRQSHALSFKSFDSLDNDDTFLNKVRISKIKQIILKAFYHVDVGNLMKSIDTDVTSITNIFLSYCKKFSAKLLEDEFDDQDILDALMTMEGDDIQTWMIDNLKIHENIAENTSSEDIYIVQDVNVLEVEDINEELDELSEEEELSQDETFKHVDEVYTENIYTQEATEEVIEEGTDIKPNNEEDNSNGSDFEKITEEVEVTISSS